MHDTTPWPEVREWHRPLLLVAAVTTPFVVISLAGITGLTLWQALRGQPLLRPDGLTLVVAGLLVALVVAGAAASCATACSPSTPSGCSTTVITS